MYVNLSAVCMVLVQEMLINIYINIYSQTTAEKLSKLKIVQSQ